MTPLQPIHTENQNRVIADLVSDLMWAHYDLDAPYQRGEVWSVSLKRDLWRTLLQKLPIGSIFANRRGHGDNVMHVVDGKQRLIAMREFMTGELSLPREWFTDEDVAPEHHGNELVNIDQLSTDGSNYIRGMSVSTISFYVSMLPTEAEEADLFLRINTSSVAQDKATLDKARQVAEGGKPLMGDVAEVAPTPASPAVDPKPEVG